ncbi:MAG: SDR family NAD(P)-dependent oxidoreductase [Hasllibacter sp.]
MDVKAIVTGGASGLGAAAAAALREIGEVVVLDRAAADGPSEVCDVTDEASVRAAVAAARDRMGGLSVCVNCAGVATAERVLGRKGPHRMDSFRRTVEVNLIGTFNVAVAAAAAMEGGGVIVNTASVAAFEGQKGQAAYAASKGGVAALTLPMARDLAGAGIRVVAIAPGVFRTPMLEGLGQEVMDGLAEDVVHPPRLGDPAEFGALVRNAVENGYLNGCTIRLDGALRMP